MTGVQTRAIMARWLSTIADGAPWMCSISSCCARNCRVASRWANRAAAVAAAPPPPPPPPHAPPLSSLTAPVETRVVGAVAAAPETPTVGLWATPLAAPGAAVNAGVGGAGDSGCEVLVATLRRVGGAIAA